MIPLGTVNQLLAQRICPSRGLRMITFITDELDFPWDPGVSSVFSKVDLTLSAICIFSDLLSIITDLRRPAPPPPPWFGLDARPTVLKPPPRYD